MWSGYVRSSVGFVLREGNDYGDVLSRGRSELFICRDSQRHTAAVDCVSFKHGRDRAARSDLRGSQLHNADGERQLQRLDGELCAGLRDMFSDRDYNCHVQCDGRIEAHGQLQLHGGSSSSVHDHLSVEHHKEQRSESMWSRRDIFTDNFRWRLRYGELLSCFWLVLPERDNYGDLQHDCGSELFVHGDGQRHSATCDRVSGKHQHCRGSDVSAYEQQVS